MRKINEYITEYSARVRVEATDETLTMRPQVHKVYELRRIKNGQHPVHKSETTETDVWIPVGSYADADAAHAHAKKLAK